MAATFLAAAAVVVAVVAFWPFAAEMDGDVARRPTAPRSRPSFDGSDSRAAAAAAAGDDDGR